MCIAVPILTLLGLVFFLFQHECFLSTVTLAGALFTVCCPATACPVPGGRMSLWGPWELLWSWPCWPA